MRATIRDDLHGRGSEGSNRVEPRWTRAPGAMVAGAVAASFPLVVRLADAGGVGTGAAAPMGSDGEPGVSRVDLGHDHVARSMDAFL